MTPGEAAEDARTKGGSDAGRRSWMVRGARVLVTGALAVFLVQLVDVGRVGALLASAEPLLLLVALLGSAADRLLMVVKWLPLLRAQVGSVSLGLAMRSYLASGVAHYVLPASIGADVVRAFVLQRGGLPMAEIGASIVAERVLGVLGTAVMSGLAVAIAMRQGLALGVVVPWALASVVLGLVLLLLPLKGAVGCLRVWTDAWLPPGWVKHLDRFGQAYAVYRRRPGLLVVVGLLTLVRQLVLVAILWFAGLALGLPVTLPMLLVATPLILFAGRVPLSLGGLGVNEGATVYLLGLYGLPPSDALALALVGRVGEVLGNAGPALFLWQDLSRTGAFARSAAPSAEGRWP